MLWPSLGRPLGGTRVHGSPLRRKEVLSLIKGASLPFGLTYKRIVNAEFNNKGKRKAIEKVQSKAETGLGFNPACLQTSQVGMTETLTVPAFTSLRSVNEKYRSSIVISTTNECRLAHLRK